LLGAWLTATDARAEVPLPGRPEKVLLVAQAPEAVAAGRIRIHPEPQAWHRLFNSGSARVTNFPLPGGGPVELEVSAFDLLNRDARFFVGGPGGPREIAGPSMRFFRGQVPGDPGSMVSLNLFEGRLAGFIRTGGKEYTFGPRDFASDRPGADDIQIVDDSAQSTPGMKCDGEETVVADTAGPAGTSSSPLVRALSTPTLLSIDASTLLLGRIAIEGTVEWVTKLGGVAAAQTYTLNLMAQVSAVYENEVKVQLQVPYVLMNAAEPDGYDGGSNSTSTVLTQMRTKWNSTSALQAVFRSAAHVFSTYPSGGAGRAYVDVLCNNVPVNANAADYGVSLLEGNGASWERLLLAHEIGHNFSSPHSHCYSPELDQCYNTEAGCYSGTVVQTTGTIMSYCNTRVTSFHQREIDEKIRPGAQAAYPACMDIAGMPGEVPQVMVSGANLCASADFIADDGAYNGTYGYSGTSRAAWVKKFTPSCYPFKLTGMDVRISNTTVAPGRAIRMLVYTDPTGSGSLLQASLAYTEDTAVQVVSAAQWNQYTLTTPVVLGSGDFYIGFFDLVADTGATYIMDYDSSRGGDSFWQADSTDPTSFGAFPPTTGTWMIRGHGGGLASGSLMLSWGPPCNDLTVPNQDFAVYRGRIGDWTDLTSLTCTTGRGHTWFVENSQPGDYWLVVPQNSANEGSYGQSTAGERPPSLSPCKAQAIGPCQ
jgi:hypothetical protein